MQLGVREALAFHGLFIALAGTVLSGSASGVIDLAIFWFMATPVVTVIAVALGFLRLGDRRCG